MSNSSLKKAEAMTQRETGTYYTTAVGGETVRAFVPAPLPPVPPLAFTAADQDLMERANRALGRLDGIASLLPDPQLFLYMYVRKEAVLSSMIEGTQSSLSDLLLFESEEAPGVPTADVVEVSNYVAAMEHGLARLRGGFPLSLRLITEIHEKLLARGRGSSLTPGEFRSSQNWVGGTRPGNATYVPPPVHEVLPCMGALEFFLHDQPERTPTLIKAALAHVQFETIHPFLDGNGRLGRLLITFLLCVEEALTEPLLYLSLFFKTHRQLYYDLLQKVRTDGDWEAWVRFFMEGVLTTANQAVATARRIKTLFETDRRSIEALGRRANSILRLHDYIQRAPLFSIPEAAKKTQLSEPTVGSGVEELVKLGLLKELTNKQRNRVFSYAPYLDILNEGAEVAPLR